MTKIAPRERTSVRVVIGLIRGFPVHFAGLLVISIFQSALNSATIILVAPITDTLFDHDSTTESYLTSVVKEFAAGHQINLNIELLFSIFGLLLVSAGLVGIATRFMILKIKYDVLSDLLGETMRLFLQARYSFFSSGKIGTLLNSFQKEVIKLGDTLGLTVTALVSLFQAIVYLTIPALLQPDLVLAFVVSSLVLTCPLWWLRRWSYKWGDANTQTANSVSAILHANLTAAKLIIGYGKQQEAADSYKSAFRDHASVAVKFATLVAGVNLFFVPLGSVAGLAVVYWGYVEGRALGGMAVFLFAFFRALPLVASVLQAKTSIEGFLPAFHQVEALSQKALEQREESGSRLFGKLSSGIVFSNVSFGYDKNVQVLKGVNLSIPVGGIVALVGKSGVGKTTIADLIMGLYPVSDGEIQIDGSPLSDFDLKAYREKIGYVPQDPVMFNLSIWENLTWAKSDASAIEIKEACRLANAWEFISEFPDGLDYVVGDQGNRLSGGQRQRISVARALLRGPEILILDEATSALDARSEELIRESIASLRGRVTTVIVAHRLETIKLASTIFVLEKGVVTESGSYDELSSDIRKHLV